jgi:hypothetical protein
MKYGTRSVSDLAAHSLQAGMGMKELARFARTVGKPLDKEELRQIGEVRRELRKQLYRGGFATK